MRSGGNGFHKRQKDGGLVCMGIVLASLSLSIFTLPVNAENEVLRSRVYKFRHIPAKQGIELLGRLGLCQVDQHSSSVIVFTSQVPADLVKASSILELLDQTEPVEFKVLMESLARQPLPVVSEVLAFLKNEPVGTLMDPPNKGTKNAGIVDVLNDKVIALAGTETMAKIEKALTEWKETHKQPAAAAEPNQPVAEKPRAVAEPNQPVAEKPRAVAEPNQPVVEKPRAVAEPNQPVAEKPKAVAEPNQPVAIQAAVKEILTSAVQPPAAPVEPNALAVKPEEKAVAEPVKPETVLKAVVSEPNQPAKRGPAKPGEEDFFSEELLKTLTAAEQKAEKTQPEARVAAEEPKEQPVAQGSEALEKPVEDTKGKQPQSPDRTAAEPQAQAPTAEEQVKPAESAADEDARFKQVVEALMEQARQEEAAAEAAEQSVSKKLPEEAKPVEPAAVEKAPEVLPQPNAPAEKAAEASAAQAGTAEQSVSEKLPEVKPVEPAVVEKAPEIAIQPGAAAGKAAEQTAVGPEAEKIKKVPTEPAIPQGEKELELTITLPEKVDIVALLELVGKQLGLNYMYDPAKVSGSVMLKIHDGKIKVKDTYALLESVMKFRGFAMTRRGSLVTIVPLAEAAQYDPTLRRPQEPIQPGDVIVSSVFELKYVNINNAQNILRQMNLGTVYIPIAETNTLIVTDYAYRMERITEILRMIDVSGEPKEFTFRRLEYMQASEILPKIQQLAAQLENVSVNLSAEPQAPQQIDPRTRRPIPVPPGQPQQGVETRQTVFLDPDDRTNRLFMIGYAEQIRIVNELIDSLDVRQYDLRYVKEYPIRNVDAAEVISVLSELGLAKVSVSKSTTAAAAQQGRSAMPPRPGPGQPAPQLAALAATVTSGGVDQPYISIRTATNSLLVNATAEQHEAIELVISYVDVEQKDKRVIYEYEIQNVDAGLIVETLGNLGIISSQAVSAATRAGSTGDSTMRRSGVSPGQGQPGEESQVATLPTAEGEAVKELTAAEPQIAVLETTNSLLVFATPRQHAAIALVIAHVDRQLDRITTPYVVYPLENQKPADLAKTLNDLINETLSPEQLAGTRNREDKIQTAPTTPAGAAPSREEGRIRIIPDESSYSLIVFANKKNQQWVGTLIKELDQSRLQVLLDCTLVEITKDDEFKFDLDMISKKGGLGASLTQLTNPITGGTSGAITATNGTALEGTVSFGAGSAFYGEDHIQALLNLIDKNGYGRVLARPSLLVKDNEEGTIKAEKIVYVAQEKSSYQPQQNVDAIQTQEISFNEYKSDITLKITPHISSDKIMQLEILLNRTDFDLTSGKTVAVGTRTIPKPYDQITSNVDTWSIVPDGATIILGGIETINQSKTNYKVPVLGDIPLVGLLFRGIGQTDKQSRLYVFVKANIIKPADELTGQSDIERISRSKRRAFEEEESRFQGLRSVPGIKPNPIIPEKILEDDEYIEKLKKRQGQGNVVNVQID